MITSGTVHQGEQSNCLQLAEELVLKGLGNRKSSALKPISFCHKLASQVPTSPTVCIQ